MVVKKLSFKQDRKAYMNFLDESIKNALHNEKLNKYGVYLVMFLLGLSSLALYYGSALSDADTVREVWSMSKLLNFNSTVEESATVALFFHTNVQWILMFLFVVTLSYISWTSQKEFEKYAKRLTKLLLAKRFPSEWDIFVEIDEYKQEIKNVTFSKVSA